MGLSEQLTQDEREQWEAFFMRIGGTLRARSMRKLLDSCERRECILSQEALNVAENILQNELTIVVLHRARGVLPS